MEKKPTYEELELRVKKLEEGVKDGQADRALLENEEKYQALFEGSVNPIAILDRDGIVLMVNPTGAKYLGLPVEECVGKSIVKMIPSLDDSYPEICQQVIDTGIELTKEFFIELPWGSRWFWLVNQPVSDLTGRRYGIQIISYDITNRKKLEESIRETYDNLEQRIEERTFNLKKVNEQLKQEIEEYKRIEKEFEKSKENYQHLVEAMNEGFIILDENLVTLYVNDKLCEMFGCERDEIIGIVITDFFYKVPKKVANKIIDKLKRDEAISTEIIVKGKHGKKIPSIVSARPMFETNNQYTGLFAVLIDISVLKQTQYRLKQREKELDIKTINLEEINTALKVLLKGREEDIKENEGKVVFNIKQLVMPYIEKLKASRLDDRGMVYVNIIESNLGEIISPFLKRLSLEYSNLTPTEVKVANLIIQGKNIKDIADVLSLSARTVGNHRSNIRKKIGIRNKKVNLKTYLDSLH